MAGYDPARHLFEWDLTRRPWACPVRSSLAEDAAPLNQRTGFASVLWSSCLAMLAVGANSTAIMAALPTMRTELFLSSAGVEWAVPAFALGVPGLLLMIAVGAQALVGAAWLPFIRRWLGGVGIRRRRSAGSEA